MEPETPTPAIVLTDRPRSVPKSTACPSCGASKERRVRSGGFGAFHDVCGECGHEFQERTV